MSCCGAHRRENPELACAFIQRLDIRLEEKAVYEEKVNALKDDKRRLYEQYLMKEISLDEYKAAKLSLDNDLKQIEQIFKRLESEVKRM